LAAERVMAEDPAQDVEGGVAQEGSLDRNVTRSEMLIEGWCESQVRAGDFRTARVPRSAN
jgi:hypothetical protein